MVFIQSKNSRPHIFFEPTTLFNCLPLCQQSLSTEKTATIILVGRFQMPSFSSDNLAEMSPTSPLNRSLRNNRWTSVLAPRKHSKWATAWRATTADPPDEMPSNAHMSHLPESWAAAQDGTSSSRGNKLYVWTAFTIRRLMPVLWLIQTKPKNSITEKWVCF